MQISDGIVDQAQQIVVVGAGGGILGKGVGMNGCIEVSGIGEDPTLIVVGHRPFVPRAVTVVIVHGDGRQRIARHIHVVLVQRLRIEQRIAGPRGRRVDLPPVDMPDDAQRILGMLVHQALGIVQERIDIAALPTARGEQQ
ncbi:hypothetical protein [uncultured Alistipes sp.]|uniref:hypothetical protein n=1 Tax=uncultured Alistipes sp. TaxID=538949 RepID=UPI002638B8E0|nr:hypothetical protein [uncultured Alistipes sp.]